MSDRCDFRVEIAELPPGDSFQGRVSVADPWIEGRLLGLNVQGERPPVIRIAPARGVLKIRHPSDREVFASFVAVLRSPSPGLRIEAEGGEANPLAVEPDDSEQGPRRTFGFVVRPKPGRPMTEGIYNVIVRPNSSPDDAVIVPVMLKKEPTS